MGRGSAARQPVLPLATDSSKSAFLEGWTLEGETSRQPTWVVLKDPEETRYLVRSLDGTRSVLVQTLDENRSKHACIGTPGATTCLCEENEVHVNIANAAAAYGLVARDLNITEVTTEGEGLLEVKVGREDYEFHLEAFAEGLSFGLFASDLLGDHDFDVAYTHVDVDLASTPARDIGKCHCGAKDCLHLDLLAVLQTAFPEKLRTLLESCQADSTYEDYMDDEADEVEVETSN